MCLKLLVIYCFQQGKVTHCSFVECDPHVYMQDILDIGPFGSKNFFALLYDATDLWLIIFD